MSPREDKTAIFWDLDGEAIPPIGMGISEACEALRHYGHDYGRLCEFKAYISPASDTELSQSTRLASDLRQNGVALSLHHPNNNASSPSAGPKELVLLSDILVFVLDHGNGGTLTVVLVTNDYSSLGYPLSLLRNRNCQVAVLSTRDALGQPRYVRRLDAVWSSRGEIQQAPPRPVTPRLPQASRVIQSPQQTRVRSHSRAQSSFASLPSILRGTPQLPPLASPRQRVPRRSGSLSLTADENIPAMSLSPQAKGLNLSSPKSGSSKSNGLTNHVNGRDLPHPPQNAQGTQVQPSQHAQEAPQAQPAQPAQPPPPPQQSRSRASSRPPTQPRQSPPGTVTATPSSPWTFHSVGSINLPNPTAPSISDVDSQSTITKTGFGSPSISTQSTNLWLHSTGAGTSAPSYVEIPRPESPTSLGLPSSLAFENSAPSDRTARPEPYAFSFRPPPGNPNVFRVGGTVEQLDEHRPFASSLGLSTASIQPASARYEPANVNTEMRSFELTQFQQPRFGSNAPSGAQSPFSSIDRGIPYPSQSASTITTIQPMRSSNGLNKNQPQPRSPRTHSRLSSYSSRSFQSASSGSPPTPQFASVNPGPPLPGPMSGAPLSGPPVPSTPVSFHPLIRVLEKFRAQGLYAPLRSAVGSELRQSDPHVYDKLGGGIRTFKEYAGAAERNGLVVLIGGSPGKEKISLVK